MKGSMAFRIKLRLFVQFIIPVACYSATWLSIMDASGTYLEADKHFQVLVMFAVLILTTIAGMFFNTLITVLCLVCISLCVLFIANVHGPHIVTLVLITLPGIFLATTRLKPVPGFCLSLMPVLALVPTIMPHTVWSTHYEGASGGQIAAIFLVCGSFIAIGLLNRHSETQIEQQTTEIQRLDFAFQKVSETNLDLQTYALFAREEAMEQERRRLAGEIHDIVGYTLTNEQILIQTALAICPQKGKMRPLLESAQARATDGLAEARRALAQLRAKESNRPKGANLFLGLVKQFSETTGITVNINFGNLPGAIPVIVEHILYHIIQEGLINSFRHGMASSVDIHFRYKDDRIYIRLRDYGQLLSNHRNVSPEAAAPGIGLASLREMVEKSGGEFSNGPVEGGYELSATIPCMKAEHEK